jgi:hypothetical protein
MCLAARNDEVAPDRQRLKKARHPAGIEGHLVEQRRGL